MTAQLTTPWSNHREDRYPRPQMRRDSFHSLNGLWEFETTTGDFPQTFSQHIRVPFAPESPLSGIGRHFSEGTALWYRRSFSLTEDLQGGRVLLHIDGADQSLVCYLGGREIGRHTGGYLPYTLDITPWLEEENQLVIRCVDDLRDTRMPYGKQVLPEKRGGMWYTPVSGLWQSVWLERVPQVYIPRLTMENRGGSVTIRTGLDLPGTVEVRGLGRFSLEAGTVTITPEDPHWWSPEDPYLYEFTLETGEDRVESYFALRTLDIRVVAGTPRLCLNGKPYFFHGLLDQGYWPDGLLTPPHPDAYRRDIETAKSLGFNTLRKHIKVEAEEFYYQCDKLGMVVFQDMMNNGDYRYLRDTVIPTLGLQVLPDRRMHRDPQTRRIFLETMESTVRTLGNHPCICCWTIFNEGWGQFDGSAAYARLKTLDSTRFVDTASGWWRGVDSDVDSRHIYFGQWWQLRKGPKPLVLSECGGLTYPEAGHLFNPGNAYGYKTCRSREALAQGLSRLYRDVLIPAVGRKGLCAAIYTQLSDVEDEINGLVTYDRQVVKVEPALLQALARELTEAMAAATTELKK